MIDKKTEALRIALEALEHEAEIGNDDAYRRERDAIREALAEQPAQQYNATSDHRLMENAQGDLECINIVQTGVGIGKPEHEPVAYSYTSRITGAQGFSHHPVPRFIDSESWDIKPLYTSPPASKPWVGLTDEEWQDLSDRYGLIIWGLFKREIEAKLQEKNAHDTFNPRNGKDGICG